MTTETNASEALARAQRVAPPSLSISIKITRSSNPAVDGDYFADVRNTSDGDRQMTTRTLHRAEMGDFIATLRSLATYPHIAVTVTDTTGEVL